MHHSLGATKAKKALPTLASFLIHTSSHLAGSPPRARFAPATPGTRDASRVTSGSVDIGEERSSLSFLRAPMKRARGPVWPCGSDMRITSRRTCCNACVIRQSSGVHTPSRRINGSQGHTSSPNVCPRVRSQWPRTRVRPRRTHGGGGGVGWGETKRCPRGEKREKV